MRGNDNHNHNVILIFMVIMWSLP